MCSADIILFALSNIKKEEVSNKKVIEVGSMDVNGSIRPLLTSYNPSHYVGVDLSSGPGVDVVCKAEKLLDAFKPGSFDFVVSTEMLEHVRDWQKVISNMKALATPGGTIYVTTRSLGFIYHAYPYDFWRYEVEDMKEIFSDCEILTVKPDRDIGVVVKVRKPINFKEKDLTNYKLYSMVTNKCQAKLKDVELQTFLANKEKVMRLNKVRSRVNPFNWLNTIMYRKKR